MLLLLKKVVKVKEQQQSENDKLLLSMLYFENMSMHVAKFESQHKQIAY